MLFRCKHGDAVELGKYFKGSENLTTDKWDITMYKAYYCCKCKKIIKAELDTIGISYGNIDSFIGELHEEGYIDKAIIMEKYHDLKYGTSISKY